MAPPISIKLRCNSWKQLAALYKRDLARSAVFLKSSAPPPLETPVRIHLTLPNREIVILDGVVYQHVPPGGLNGRGPGVDIKLPEIPAPAMAKIQAALESPDKDEGTGRSSPLGSDRTESADGDGQEAGAPDAPAEQPAPPAPAEADEAAHAAHGSSHAGAQRAPTPPPDNPLGSFLDDDLLGDLAPPPPGRATQAPATSPADEMAAIHEAAERVARLEQERESLRKLNAFQILGVGYETTDEAVHEAFASLSQRYHPDRFAGEENEAARDIAVEIFALIRAAHRLLENGNSRERLRRELNRADRGAEAAAAPATGSGPIPASPQEEINTKPVLVAEDGTPVGEPGAPASPQEEIPTKPSPVSENNPAEPAAARPATPPPIPKSRPAPPPIPESRPAAPPPIPTAKPPVPVAQDEDIIPIDDLGVEEEPASAPHAAVATPPAPAALDSLDDQLGVALQPFEETPPVSEPAEEIPAAAEDAPPAEPEEAPAPPEEPAAVPVAAEAPPVAESAEDAADRAAAQAAQAVAADDTALGMASAPQFAEAIALIARGKFSEAASVYRVARRRDPDDVAAKVGLELCEGLKALANRDKLEAAQRFEAALELDPDNRRAASELAEIRRQAAQQRKANLIRLRDQID